MASYRHLGRILVMQTLYVFEFRGADAVKTLKDLLEGFGQKVKNNDFPSRLLEGILKNKESIGDCIEKHAPEWPMDKIAPIDRACLEIGVYELLFNKEEIPPIVAINEAVEIAKEYGSENSGKFVNGVLSAVYEELKISLKKI